MASLTFTQFLALPRWHSSWPFFPSVSAVKFQDARLQNQWVLRAASKKKNVESFGEETGEAKQPVKRGRKKAVVPVTPDSDQTDEENTISAAAKSGVKKTRGRPRLKVVEEAELVEEVKAEQKEKRVRKPKKKVEEIDDVNSEKNLSDQEMVVENAEEEPEIVVDVGDDISHLYGWPPLVCCFGAAQHAFVPSGRPANRLIDHEVHARMRDARWAPEKFIRAPGSSSGSVAIALASLGGKVEFMGKLGNDDYGQSMLWFMNSSKVQTRSVRLDSKKATAVSLMKISKRGGLRMTSAKLCAEDSLTKSEINIDVLKEAKMFYFNTTSLLEKNMTSTTLHAIQTSKKLGGVIFYDVNLPMPLWLQSSEETREFINQAWSLADIIEVTKQELEFLCGIKPSERFDTKDNDQSKFVHYDREIVSQLWHENLKVLFVTNGTSKIHYYTKDNEGFVRGMEDPPVTPFTADMSASGDGIVAALLRMLTVQPDLITDKGYLEHTIKYAINCGVIDQWSQARIRGFPGDEDSDNEVEPDPDGIRSVTETQYRSVDDPEELEVPDPQDGIILLSEKVMEPEEEFELVS